MRLYMGQLRYIDIGSRDGIDKNFLKYKDHIKYTGFDPGADITISQENQGFLEETIINKAVYNTDGKLSLHITKSPYNSSLLLPHKQFVNYFSDPSRFEVQNTISVETIRLSQVLRTYGDEEIFIKIDAQGISADLMEECVGFEDIIGMEIEVSLNPTYEKERGLDEVLMVAKRLGYRIYDLDPTYWKPKAAAGLAGHKGMTIYGDALFLPSEIKLEEWSKKLERAQAIKRLDALLMICAAYNIYDYFFFALSFFSDDIRRDYEETRLQLLKTSKISRLFGLSKVMIFSSLLRDLADLLQAGTSRQTFTTHSMGNRARNPRFRFLRW